MRLNAVRVLAGDRRLEVATRVPELRFRPLDQPLDALFLWLLDEQRVTRREEVARRGEGPHILDACAIHRRANEAVKRPEHLGIFRHRENVVIVHLHEARAVYGPHFVVSSPCVRPIPLYAEVIGLGVSAVTDDPRAIVIIAVTGIIEGRRGSFVMAVRFGLVDHFQVFSEYTAGVS